ncbi:polymorphic toxin-type HINT domain-containing protein [Streptomyces acidiscabies]|uniref:polymorphic toxin-type HINT domain-containing protein n=1 Tax=Streptomyces acidiscabies TaxID=42234 RepID=UPI0030D1FCF5
MTKRWRLAQASHDRAAESRRIRRQRAASRGAITGLLPLALVAGLLGTPSATAADDDSEALLYRPLVVEYWRTGGTGVQEAAEQALLGGPAEIRAFLDGVDTLQAVDDRVDVSRVVNAGGFAVREAAKAALGPKKTPKDVAAFLVDGWKAPLDQDRRVEASRVINFGGPGVQEAGKAALQGSPEDVKKFLDEGQYTARVTDNRVQVSKLISAGGPAMKAAGKLALQGTPDDVVEFLEVGQFTARDRDQEHATIAQLTAQAKQAGARAEDAAKSAQEASDKAVLASELAKAAAQEAAKQTAAAKDDAFTAAARARQAADAARAAAGAAQTAIGAANAATRSARIAALAAAQTSAAATAAANAAGAAYRAAADAASDKNSAAGAQTMAAQARAAGALAKASAAAAEQAAKASAAAGAAVRASQSAAGNANAAADAADEASRSADAAGAHSAEAQAAAAETRRHAREANRAAGAAAALADESAAAAYGARDAANSAAVHAENAAAAAEEAAKHAGEASTAAAKAAAQAAKAKEAAATATAAAATAHKVFDVTRKTEAEDLLTRTNADMETAQSQKDATSTFTSQIAQVALEDIRIGQDTTALAAEADKPGADTTAIAAKGRSVAMRALKQYGAWRQEAAARALSGDDAEVLDYLRTGAGQAQVQEIRQQVSDLAATSPYESVRTAAVEALQGTDQQVRDFSSTGQYTAGATDYRVLVSKINNDGGPSVKDASKAALADGSPRAMRSFLNGGQYEARTIDERVLASKLVNDGGPEMKAAAKIALTGPADELHEFIQAGQYMADRKDQLAQTHTAQMQRLLNDVDGVAATARQDSWLAAKAAATAKNAKTEAAQAAAEAQKSATQASTYAADAKKSADQAQTSANAAAQSAKTASAAAARANQDANTAAESADQAEWSANYARDSASAAHEAADEAEMDAITAGESATAAKGDAAKAWSDVLTKRQAEAAAARKKAEEERQKQREQEAQAKKSLCVNSVDPETLQPCSTSGNLDGPRITAGIGKFLLNGGMELLGVNDVIDCVTDPALGKCTLAVAGVLPVGKVKLLKKAADGVEAIADGSRATKTAKAAEECVQCFLAGTRVLMADHSTKNIESVQVSDLVMATNPVTGFTAARTVTRLIITEHDKHFNELTLATQRGTEHLTATNEHPFWSPSAGTWVSTERLRPGATLRTVDGTTVTVRHNRPFEQIARTYNLTVADLHTYYVLAGNTPVLVHNSGGCLTVLRDWNSQIFKFGNETLLLDKKGMEHILTRHHPKYWDGSVKKTQSFFDPNMSVSDVQNAIGEVMKQNRDTLLQRGSKGMYQISGKVNGVDYVLGMNKGRVGQFYPTS